MLLNDPTLRQSPLSGADGHPVSPIERWEMSRTCAKSSSEDAPVSPSLDEPFDEAMSFSCICRLMLEGWWSRIEERSGSLTTRE